MFPTRLRHLLPALLISGSFALPAGLGAQARACNGPEHRQFDFWVGSWRVERPDGTVVGYNNIRRQGDCFLHESYTTPTGYQGESLNIYDGARGVWHQSWVDNGGLLLQLDGGFDGGFDGGSMILQGPGIGQGGVAVINRITWSLVNGDADYIRQLWETSADDGRTWSVAFDGHYHREAGN